jgi:phospholipid/cholesterol/gamma-HCH transport system substrate-binding protein
MMARTSAHGRSRRGPGRSTAIKFLLFAIVTISLTLYMAYAIVGSDLHPTYRVAATFDDVSGLATGDLVKVAGTPVGRVTGVKVVDGRAAVDMDVNRNIRIPVDSRAAIRWRNLIGQREVYLIPGTSNAVLHDGAHVNQTQSAVDLGEVINSLGPLTGSLDPNEINQILQSFAVALSGNEGNITQITTNLSILLQVFGSRSGTIHQMIANYKTVTDAVATRDQQIAETVQNLQTLTRAFADNRAVLDGATVQLRGLTANLNTVLGGQGPQLGNVVESTAALLEIAHRNVSQLSGLLRGLPAALQALLTTMDGGHFVRGTVLCIDVVQTDVCRFPETLPPPPQVQGGSGSGSRPLTPAQQTSFQRMASLFLLGTQIKGQ